MMKHHNPPAWFLREQFARDPISYAEALELVLSEWEARKI